MSLHNFIPTVWSGLINQNVHKALVYGNPFIINRDYEGEINGFGDTVKINSIGAVTVRTYTRDTDIVAPDTLDSAQTVLTINQSDYFHFEVDNIDMAQTKPKVMEEATREAGYALGNAADIFIAGMISGQVATANTIGSSGSPKTDLATSGKAYAYLVQLAQKLNEASAPALDRWVIVPPWFYAWIQQDANFVHSTTAADILLRTGKLDIGNQANMEGLSNMPTGETFVGYAAGFAVFMSNNVPNSSSTSYQIVAGVKRAWSFADQIVKTEAYSPPLRFADALKGLHVYGGAVIKPNLLALLYANPT